MYDAMTASEALAWVANRDEAFATQCRGASGKGLILRLGLDYASLGQLEKNFTPQPSLDAIALGLVIACRSGAVLVEGIRQNYNRPPPEGGSVEKIPVTDWEMLWLSGLDGEIKATPETQGPQQRYFTDWHFLRFPRDQVVAAFPPDGKDTEAASAVDAGPMQPPTLTEGVNGPVPADGATDEPPALRKAASKADTEAAYRDYVARHAGPKPPGRENDLAHMRSLFPNIHRDRVRDLRRTLAPESWSQKGRPKSAN